MSQQNIAVVTGSSSGIGLLTTIELALNGYQVVATMRDLERSGRLEEAAQTAAVRGKLELRRLDITEFDTLQPAVEQFVRSYGRIDVLVNNAGFPVVGFGEDLLLQEYRKQLETNFFGNVAMTKAVLPAMREQKSGHIIQVTSVSGRAGQPMLSAYCASKFALEGFSESLRIETHSLGIRVAIVEPGAFDTDIWERNLYVGEQARHPSSPNQERSRRFADFVKNSARSRGDAREVAQLIVRIAKNPNPRLRYIVGADVRMQLWLRRIAPWKTYERLIAKAVKID